MTEYFLMGSHTAYIWAAWGIAGVLMLAIWSASAALLRRQAALLAALEAAGQTVTPKS
ncbi:MAG: heme exporter protein CcmD [Caulobacter sp.]|nr:heme exporter protein CcmD [Caulobacter sp.]MDP1670894.1 heme exporter protein CcmD [Alphaproteobacteria bacterium]